MNNAHITCHDIYFIAGFPMEISSYGARVVGLIRDHLGGVHMGTC